MNRSPLGEVRTGKEPAFHSNVYPSCMTRFPSDSTFGHSFMTMTSKTSCRAPILTSTDLSTPVTPLAVSSHVVSSVFLTRAASALVNVSSETKSTQDPESTIHFLAATAGKGSGSSVNFVPTSIDSSLAVRIALRVSFGLAAGGPSSYDAGRPHLSYRYGPNFIPFSTLNSWTFSLPKWTFRDRLASFPVESMDGVESAARMHAGTVVRSRATRADPDESESSALSLPFFFFFGDGERLRACAFAFASGRPELAGAADPFW